MAADVSSLLRMMNGGDANEPTKSTALITRDLLGGCCIVDSKELDLELQVPCGWEKRLDLKSGRVYVQRCNLSNSSTTSTNSENRKSIQDLNFPPTWTKPTLTLFDEVSLDLKLVSPPSAAASPSSGNYQSVCTLDKVKSALDRAEKEAAAQRKQSSVSMSSTSSSSIKDADFYPEEKSSSGSAAAGCPNCLLYVLISRNNPKCPRCNSNVPLPPSAVDDGRKKPRIDLNISM